MRVVFEGPRVVLALLVLAAALPASAGSTLDYTAKLALACQGENRGRAAGKDTGTLTLTDGKLKIESSNRDAEVLSLAYFQSAKPWCATASDAERCLRKLQKGDVFKLIAGDEDVDASHLRRDTFESSVATFDGTLKYNALAEPVKLSGTLILFDEESGCMAQMNLKARAEFDGGALDPPPSTPGVPNIPEPAR